MIWTHTKGFTSTCLPYNRNLEMPYYGRYSGGCAYTVEGTDPATETMIAIFPDGYAEFRNRDAVAPDMLYRYPDCAGGLLPGGMNCISWNDDASAWECCTETCDCTGTYIEVLGVGTRQILDNDEGNILDESGNPIEGIIESECGEAQLECVAHCNAGTTPRAWSVVIANASGGFDSCTWFNATFVPDVFTFTETGFCQWIYKENPEQPLTNSVVLSIGADGLIEVQAENITGAGYIITFRGTYPDGAGGDPYNCDTVSDWPVPLLGYQQGLCDFTQATCRITAIP